jgi:PilZ domain-containing protein
MFIASRYRNRFRRARFEVRKAFRGDVEVIAPLWDDPLPFEARDLSPAGVFLETDLPLGPDSELVVSFWVPSLARELSLFARVARVSLPRRRSDHGVAGMGIRFLDISPLERLHVRESLRGCPPPIPCRQ